MQPARIYSKENIMDQAPFPSRRRPRRWALALTLPLVAALATGCGGDGDSTAGPTASAPPSGVPAQSVDRKMVEVPDAYVGKIADTETFIAVTFNDEIVRAYACDGEGTDNAIAQWFQGPWDGTSPVTLTGGPFQLTLKRDGDGIAGHLETADGERLPFHASLPTANEGGLYETQVFDPATGQVRAQGHTIVLGSDERGVIIPVVTRCRRVRKTIVLADGTTTTIVVEICG
jgi:hypothetical protein